MVVDGAGNLYIADTSNHRIRKVDTSGTITSVAGSGAAYESLGTGPATEAVLRRPEGVAVDNSGNLYIADTFYSRIRKVDTSGSLTTIAGTEKSGYSGDGGPAIKAQLHLPVSVAVDNSGNIYVADTHNHRVRLLPSDTTAPTVESITIVSDPLRHATYVEGEVIRAMVTFSEAGGGGGHAAVDDRGGGCGSSGSL